MSAWDNPQEMLARAETANAQGDRDMAYQMYARASELNPQDPTAWRGRAQTAANQDEALVSYAYASALYPEDASLTQALDTSLTQRLADSNPGDVPLLIEVGQEFAEVGLTAHAQQVFTRAADLDENASDAVIWLAGLETDKEKQTAYLNRALAINPRDPRARAGLLTINPPAPPPLHPPNPQRRRASRA